MDNFGASIYKTVESPKEMEIMHGRIVKVVIW
jgi:hypothetical protein